MAYKFVAGKQLKGLLNDVENVHKKDIHDFAGGHLNESLLLMAPTATTRKSWSNSQTQPCSLLEQSKFVHKPLERRVTFDTPMEDVLYHFSVGTSGSMPVSFQQTIPTTRYPQASQNGDNEARANSGQSVYSQLQDGVLVEELPSQEIMLPSHHGSSKDHQSDEDNPRLTPSTFRLGDVKLLSFKRDFVPNYGVGVTKEDQFREMQLFEKKILKKKEAEERNVLSGKKAVKHHEKKLRQELAAYHLDGMGPNFPRLQIFSNTFDDLIEDSPTFSYILRCIKAEYDNYISRLLDGQPSQHHLLHDQVENMTARGTSRPSELQLVMDRVFGLEEEGQQLLEDNDRMRRELRDQTELFASLPEQPSEIRQGPSVFHSEPPTELADEIEHVKASILEKLDALKALRANLRDEHVPQTVCTHLEQCIKETEIEVQKLLKQNEYFERSIEEMEQDLKEAIVEADTSEKDARRIWRKVNSTKGMPGMRPLTSQGESDDEDDDESKWNWYIS